MIALLMLYPGLSAVKLVGTDLVQAVPLVLSAAIANIAIHGLDWDLLIPLVIGSVPGTIIGSRIAPRVPQSYIRRGIVVVLTMSGVALLFKAGLHPFGEGHETLEAIIVALVGIAMLALVPFVWGLLRKQTGLPMFGAPTVAELEKLPGDRAGQDESAQLVPAVDVAGVDLVGDVVERVGPAVGDDDVGALLELVEVVDDLGVVEVVSSSAGS